MFNFLGIKLKLNNTPCDSCSEESFTSTQLGPKNIVVLRVLSEVAPGVKQLAVGTLKRAGALSGTNSSLHGLRVEAYTYNLASITSMTEARLKAVLFVSYHSFVCDDADKFCSTMRTDPGTVVVSLISSYAEFANTKGKLFTYYTKPTPDQARKRK